MANEQDLAGLPRRLTWMDRALRAERELAALRQKIAEAPTGYVIGWYNDFALCDSAHIEVPTEWVGDRVALLPVGGE